MYITPPNNNSEIVSSVGYMREGFRQWTVEISKLGIIIGTGSPEGVVTADQGQEYMDEAGTTGNIKYIKRDFDIAGDRSKGWILV